MAAKNVRNCDALDNGVIWSEGRNCNTTLTARGVAPSCINRWVARSWATEPVRRVSTFSGGRTAGARGRFSSFLFKLMVQMKNSVSCRCPKSVKKIPKSCLGGSNTLFRQKKTIISAVFNYQADSYDPPPHTRLQHQDISKNWCTVVRNLNDIHRKMSF